MTPHVKWSIAGIVLGLILLIILPTWAVLGIIFLAIAIPGGAWLALDPGQRRRYRELRRRRRGEIR